ncbi:MAG: hypothetical protein AB1762_16400, partial [Gemmatimonadota bacterium]
VAVYGILRTAVNYVTDQETGNSAADLPNADKWKGAWKFQPDAYTSPNATAIRRLRFAADVFHELGAAPPPSGRHENARRLLQSIDRRSVRAQAPSRLREIAEANRMSWEFFVIAYAVNELPSMRTTDIARRVADMMRGGALPDEKRTLGRDTQFELYVGALFALCGFPVSAREPDLAIGVSGETLGVACKRLRSLNAAKLRERFNEAHFQLTGTRPDRESEYSKLRVVRGRGLIAVNLDVYFEDVKELLDDDSLVNLFHERAKPALECASRFREDHAVLGMLFFGHASAWVFPSEAGQPDRLAHRMPMMLFTSLDPTVERVVLRPTLESFLARAEAAISRLQQL